VTASDKIYSLSPYEIEQQCIRDLDIIIKQLPNIEDLFMWNFFKDMQALENNRKNAYRLFIEDFRTQGTKRYVPVEYPSTDFHDNQFTISELLRVTSKEIRIFPIVNL
jgi:hypothetical protein